MSPADAQEPKDNKLTIGSLLRRTYTKYHGTRRFLLISCAGSAIHDLAPKEATWPAVFAAIESDLSNGDHLRKEDCKHPFVVFPKPIPLNEDAKASRRRLYCAVVDRRRESGSDFGAILHNVYEDVNRLDAKQRWALQEYFSIGGSFVGTGYSLFGLNSEPDKDSKSDDDILRSTYVAEFLVKNIRLRDHPDCKCYDTRDTIPQEEVMNASFFDLVNKGDNKQCGPY